MTETGATAVYSTWLTEPHAIKVDFELIDILDELGVGFRVFDGNLLFPPESVTTKNDEPFKVFTPFYKACMKKFPPSAPILPAPKKFPCPRKPVKSDSLDEWKLLPTKPDWSSGWLDIWTPGEQGALLCLDPFLEQPVAGYETQRDRPDIAGTSRLSPHFHFGEISPLLCCHGVLSHIKPEAENSLKSFIRQIMWREFSQHLFYHWPTFPEKPFRPEFERFPWVKDEEALRRWQRGLTGYPIVDAGMRELWVTGWIHNRVRMIAASFFRIFNPMLQGRKFDPDGAYVRRWVPELVNLPNKYIHEPWTASKYILQDSGVFLGKNYCLPVIDHINARNREL